MSPATRLLDDRALSMYVQIDRNLALKPFLAGSAFSLADIAGYTITAAYAARLPWQSLPHVCPWFDAIRIRPGVVAGMQAFSRLAKDSKRE